MKYEILSTSAPGASPCSGFGCANACPDIDLLCIDNLICGGSDTSCGTDTSCHGTDTCGWVFDCPPPNRCGGGGSSVVCNEDVINRVGNTVV